MNNALRIQLPTAGAQPPPPALNQEDRIGRDDRSALIGCHEPSYLEYLTGQLRSLGYKVHHGVTQAQAVQRLATRSYQIIVLLENLEGCALADNGLWRHLMSLSTDERRVSYVIMLCQSFTTGDELSAYAVSVDQLINYQDIGQFAALVRPAVEEHNEGNRFFEAAMRKAA